MRATFSIIVLFALTAAARADEPIQWVRDLETAKRIAAQSNRPILIHFWAPSCAPCLKLDQEVYTRPEVKRGLEAMFVPVRLNAEEYPATASIYGVDRWPADVILAPNGQFVARLQCPPMASQYLAQVELVARSSRAGPNDNGAAIAAGAAPSSSSVASAPPSMGAFAPPPNFQKSAFNTVSTAAPSVNTAAPAASTNMPAPSTSFCAPTDRIASYDFRNADLARANAQRGAAYSADPRAGQAPAANVAAVGMVGAGAAVPGAPGVGVPGVEFAAATESQAVHQGVQQAPAQYAQQPLNIQFEMVAAGDAPPVGLDGFCPVQLRKEGGKQGRWVKGDPRYGVVHRGRTYLFCGPAEQQEFLRDPDRYSPVMAGNDPVLALDFGQQVPGQRKIGRYYGDRVYMFATEETLSKFLAEVNESQARSRPNRYAEAILQAENTGRGMMR